MRMTLQAEAYRVNAGGTECREKLGPFLPLTLLLSEWLYEWYLLAVKGR